MADLMHRPISLITPVIWLIVLVLFGFPLRAQLREAAFNGYCHSFRFLVGTASSGGFNFEMVFTSYDGGASTVLYDTDASGYAIFSDELSPNFSEPGVYRTDYALYVNKKYNAAGTISVTLPTVDSDQNGITDFLQKNKQGNVSVSGRLLRQLPSPLPEIPFSGQIIRPAGSSQGTYSFTGRDPEVGDVTYRGDFYLVNLLGKLKYNTTNRTVSIETDIEREGGVVIRVSSSLEYSIVDGNTISFPAGKFTSPNQPDSLTKAFVLKRTGNRYLGRIEFVDAFRGTSWPDYTAWQLEIVDTNDSDRDGVPDLSDPPIVQSPPTISVQPVSQTRTVGEAVALTVQASGSGVLSYSWRKNGVPVLNFGVVSGANGPTLSFASLQTSHAGAYSVVVSNSVGSVTSSGAQLTVNPVKVGPTIVAQPQPVTVPAGQMAVFMVVATGTEPLGYQWQRNGVNLPGANASTLTINKPQLSDAGDYRVVVSDIVGSVVSSVAQLTVNSAGVPPTIVVQPVSAAVRVGQQVTLSVQAAGTPTPSYQWQRNGANLPGATSAEWVIRSATLNDAGEYRVVVANSSGTVTSTPAFVAVLAPEYLPAITQQPQGTNLVVGQRLELRVIATGNPEPAYRWRKDGVYLDGGTGPVWTKPSVTMVDAGVYQVIVSNSVGAVFSAQASVVVVPGTVVPRIVGFREIGGGDLDFDVDATAGREWVLEDSRILGNWSEVSRFLANQQRFSLRVPYQSSNSRFFRLRQADVGGKAPVIIQEPQDLTVRAGSNAVFTVVAEGTGPLVYQWFFDGATIPGSRQSTLILTDVRSLNAGNYWVSVTNSVGFVFSSFAKLTVDADKPIGTEGFVWIPPGTFVMGSPPSEEGRYDNEVQHTVKLTQGFWLSDHEVTQAEYQAVMGNNPSSFKGDLNRPVEQVSWNEAVEYCQKLTARERAAGRITAQQVYRLPTEAEWEYAARAGTTGARYGEFDAIAWWAGNSGYQTNPVRKKAANSWGLYDMMGNVWELCADWYASYPSGTVTDPVGPGTGSFRVVRGGSWNRVDRNTRSASRSTIEPERRADVIGFRPALSSVR
jgi:formylglycine-generating enzyme required for sulfatase activity